MPHSQEQSTIRGFSYSSKFSSTKRLTLPSDSRWVYVGGGGFHRQAVYRTRAARKYAKGSRSPKVL